MLQEKCELGLPLNWHSSSLFLNMCLNAKKNGLKMKNVRPFWYHSRYLHRGKKNLKKIGRPIYSLVGLDPVIVDIQMPNLEKITIPSTQVCVVKERTLRPEWPKLKCLDISVDGNEGKCFDFREAMSAQEGANRWMSQDTEDIFAFLFIDVKSEKMEELKIKFVEGMVKNVERGRGRRIPEFEQKAFENLLTGKRGGGHTRWEIRDEMCVPSLELIVESCPNLKRVVLGNWQGTNQDLLIFWNGLGEGLELGDCENVGDFTFFGNDKEKPVFLKLKNLKKLSLKGLDKMAKVTDLLFMEILAKMKLKQLVITSEKPLDKVTKTGILALLKGTFAETIDKFPFNGWSLADVTHEEFEEMGKKFRSYNML